MPLTRERKYIVSLACDQCRKQETYETQEMDVEGAPGWRAMDLDTAERFNRDDLPVFCSEECAATNIADKIHAAFTADRMVEIG